MANSADPDQLAIDLDLCCLQRQGISGFSRTRVNKSYPRYIFVPQSCSNPMSHYWGFNFLQLMMSFLIGHTCHKAVIYLEDSHHASWLYEAIYYMTELGIRTQEIQRVDAVTSYRIGLETEEFPIFHSQYWKEQHWKGIILKLEKSCGRI